MVLKKEKKGLTNGELIVFLVVALFLVGSGILFFYNYSKSSPIYQTEYVVLDDNFRILQMNISSSYLTFTIKRTGGIEDYKGFQIFLEDRAGRVFSQEVYSQIEINEERTIKLDYKSRINNLKYVTISPIY